MSHFHVRRWVLYSHGLHLRMLPLNMQSPAQKIKNQNWNRHVNSGNTTLPYEGPLMLRSTVMKLHALSCLSWYPNMWDKSEFWGRKVTARLPGQLQMLCAIGSPLSCAESSVRFVWNKNWSTLLPWTHLKEVKQTVCSFSSLNWQPERRNTRKHDNGIFVVRFLRQAAASKGEDKCAIKPVGVHVMWIRLLHHHLHRNLAFFPSNTSKIK